MSIFHQKQYVQLKVLVTISTPQSLWLGELKET